MTQTSDEIRSLLAACRKLMRSILTVSHEDQDARGRAVRIRAAKRHVHEAVRSLNFHPHGTESSLGSLDRMAVTLTTRLVQDLMAEVDCERDREIQRRVSTIRDRDGFHGYTWAISLPDLMGFLQMQQKCGTLRVNIGTEVISLIFDDGDLIHASSDNSPPGSRLGEILVEEGALDLGSLEDFLVRCSVSPGRLGNTLEAEGLITRAHLRGALDVQVQRIFDRLFASENAYYAFREGHAEQDVEVRRNVFQLLLETCREHDEARQNDPETGSLQS